MKRTLIIANVLLLVLIVFCVWLFRARKAEAEAKQQQLLRATVPAPKTAVVAAPAVLPVSPQIYAADAVQKFVFTHDRNPNVIVKPVAKPPEPPMPPLPAAFGLFLMGDKPTIFLAVTGSGQRGYHAGDDVGAFKLLDFDAQKVTFEWNGKKVERTMEELARNTVAAAPAPVETQAAQAPAPTPPPFVTNAENKSSDPNVGPEIGANEHACVAGDTSPEGTVSADGLKKVVTKSPFGNICRWTK